MPEPLSWDLYQILLSLKIPSNGILCWQSRLAEVSWLSWKTLCPEKEIAVHKLNMGIQQSSGQSYLENHSQLRITRSQPASSFEDSFSPTFWSWQFAKNVALSTMSIHQWTMHW